METNNTDPSTVLAAEICVKCFKLRGRLYKGNQLCDCDCSEYIAAGRDVPRYGDLSIRAELCRCCALEVLRSRSRWSVWFCEECKARVVDLNESAGRCVVPIGRHSLMNGVWQRVGEHGLTDAEATAFYDQLSALFRQTDEGWVRRQTAANIEALGLADQRNVPLRLYMNAIERSALSKADAFEHMTGEEAIRYRPRASAEAQPDFEELHDRIERDWEVEDDEYSTPVPLTESRLPKRKDSTKRPSATAREVRDGGGNSQ